MVDSGCGQERGDRGLHMLLGSRVSRVSRVSDAYTARRARTGGARPRAAAPLRTVRRAPPAGRGRAWSAPN